MHERYERFFRLLGANNNQAKALSVAQIYGLLDDPYDKNIKRAVSEYLKIDQESLMELLDIGGECTPPNWAACQEIVYYPSNHYLHLS
jgi:hypothetical protein